MNFGVAPLFVCIYIYLIYMFLYIVFFNVIPPLNLEKERSSSFQPFWS